MELVNYCSLSDASGRRHKIIGREHLWAAVRMDYGGHLHGRPPAPNIFECERICLSSIPIFWHLILYTVSLLIIFEFMCIEQIKRGSVEVRPKTSKFWAFSFEFQTLIHKRYLFAGIKSSDVLVCTHCQCYLCRKVLSPRFRLPKKTHLISNILFLDAAYSRGVSSGKESRLMHLGCWMQSFVCSLISLYPSLFLSIFIHFLVLECFGFFYGLFWIDPIFHQIIIQFVYYKLVHKRMANNEDDYQGFTETKKNLFWKLWGVW